MRKDRHVYIEFEAAARNRWGGGKSLFQEMLKNPFMGVWGNTGMSGVLPSCVGNQYGDL